jgi:hypothetical protein
MPSAIKIQVQRARGLPIMDAGSRGLIQQADPYVEIEFANEKENERTTRIQRKTLDPEWNEEFRIEVLDDSQLQTWPIVFKYVLLVRLLRRRLLTSRCPRCVQGELLRFDADGRLDRQRVHRPRPAAQPTGPAQRRD